MKITFTDKTSIDNRPDLSDIEKITGGNINEIKEVVNANEDELDATKVKVENINTSLENFNKEVEALKENDTKQDEKIEYLEKEAVRLRQDIEASQLIGEAEGESIDLEDSSGARFKKFGVGGNHSQETREGYNIVDLTSFPKGARNGITATVDLNKGSITLNGTCTGTFAYAIPLALNAGTVVSYGLNNLQTNSEVTMRFEVTDNTQEGQISCAQKNAKMENFALTKDTVSWQLRIGKGTVLTDFVIYPQIEVGSTLHKFETYGATPSLDFTSEIKTVKDNVNVVVCNKNKLKLTEISEIPGISVSKNNGKLVLNGTATSTNDGIKIGKFYAKKDKTYILSITNKILGFGVNLNNNKVGINENLINIVKSSTAKVSKAAIATDNGKVDVYIAINKDTVFNNFEVEIQIEENTTATSIIEHQEQTITMPVQQEMLEGDYFDWENEKEVHKWNLLSFTGNEAWSLLSGATSVFLLGNVSGQTYNGHNFSMCTHFKYDTRVAGMANLQDETFAMQYEYSALYVKCNKFTTVEEWKAYLKSQYENGTPIKLAYITANITELSFTEEQKAVAKKIKETLHTYKNITHIYSTDETNPVLNVEYAKDLNTVINNMQAQIINNASEEVNG